MQRRPLDIRLIQIGSLIAMLVLFVLSLTHLAFGWFKESLWYDWMTWGLLALSLLGQLRLLAWLRKNRA